MFGSCRISVAALLDTGLRETAVQAKIYRADTVVYDGTSSGVIAAVQAKRMVKTVILVGPDNQRFHQLGVFHFTKSKPAVVTVTNEGSDGYVIVDAVQ